MNAPRNQQIIIGEAPEFMRALEHVSRAAALSKPVLVLGERGTGKELFASRIHFLSPRWGQPLVKVNCAALTESILESELFGHEAGSFTGASKRHIGRFERADGGTLLLDELGTIGPRMQEKILRVIEYGEFERVGGSQTIRVDVRIVGSTNANLQKMAAEQSFRSDLLDRLAFDVVGVPPLRRRLSDIDLLSNHFAVGITSELGRPFFPGFSEHAMSTLTQYSWPGNVRELKNAIERSVYRNEEEIEPVDEIILNPFENIFSDVEEEPDANGEQEIISEQESERLNALNVRSSNTEQPSFPMDLKKSVKELEENSVLAALKHHHYHQGHTAKALNLSYHQLRAYLRKYKIEAKPAEDLTN